VTFPPRTAWRLRAIDGVPRLRGLDVQLTVDTTAPAVVDAIETAAALHGIELERVVERDQERDA